MHPHAQKMERSLTEHVGDVLGGHASVLTHTLLAGVAAEAIGGESNADVNFGAVWTTAAWAVVLGSHVNEEHESGLPALLGVGRRSVLGDETPR